MHNYCLIINCCLIINFLGNRADNMYVTSQRYRDIENTKDKSISLNNYGRVD